MRRRCPETSCPMSRATRRWKMPTIWETRPRTSNPRSRSRSRTTREKATASGSCQPDGQDLYLAPPDGFGAIAQLGERYNGIVEVGGSTPPGSTNYIKGLAEDR